MALACAGVLAVILCLGLWPFHSPKNDVTWAANRRALICGRNSVILSSGTMPAAACAENGGSMEIWLQPGLIWDTGTVVSFSRPGAPYQLCFKQVQLTLEIQTGRGQSSIDRFFPRTGPVFLTITSGPNGTSVYRDGKLLRTLASPRLTVSEFSGQMIVADSAGQADSWKGLLFGLAVYHRELTPVEVAGHYVSWTKNGRPEIADGEKNVALYLFNEGAGDTVYNAAAPGPDLFIPERYTVQQKILLEPFWKEFSFSSSYWSSALKNIVGFVPVGFCFYAWFAALRLRRAALAAVLTGTAISVTIEVLQAFLPTRDSGTTDIFTNTLGTWAGVAAYRVLQPVLRSYGLPD